MTRVAAIIEDNPDSARLAQKLLKRADFEVLTADEGEIGFDLVVEKAPDVVLVDLGLPDLDGQTIIAMLRQQPTLQAMAIIAFTAWPQDTAEEMAAAYGCDGVLTKPIDTRTFVQQVEAVMARKTSAADDQSDPPSKPESET